MTKIVLVAGVVGGAQYAYDAFCLCVTYRASKVLNLAQGAVWLAAATTFAMLDTWPAALAGAAAIAVAMAIGAAIEWSTRTPEPLARLTAVAGWFLLLGSVLAARRQIVRARYPLGTGTVEVFGIRVGYEAVAVVVLAVVLPALAWLVIERTAAGAQVVAVADAPDAAAVLGLGITRVRRTVWIVLHVVIAVAGILSAPRTGLEPSTSFMLLAGGLAAALLGGLQRLALPVLAGFGLGLLTAWLGGRVIPSGRDAIVLVAVIAALMIRRAPAGDVAFGRV